MKMTYKNEFGAIDIFGGGNSGFRLRDTDGLELLGRERGLVKFIGSDGYMENSAYFTQRVITLSGDIRADDEEEIFRAMRVFSHPGTLTIESFGGDREIEANDALFKTSRENGSFKSFCLQLTCDMPHFTECEDIEKGLYARKNNITGEALFPMVFTERVQGGIIENKGDVVCEPKLIITCMEDTEETGNITIKNNTTGGAITLNYKPQKGEVITADIPGRVIISDISGDITNTLSEESFLCDIFMLCGENDFSVEVGAGNRNCEIIAVYRNRYAGVVV